MRVEHQRRHIGQAVVDHGFGQAALQALDRQAAGNWPMKRPASEKPVWIDTRPRPRT
jgi:hypothetical protein